MSQFVFDIETLGVESDSVVLSAAIVCIPPDIEEYDGETLDELYHLLLEHNTLYVKFKAKEQIDAGRRVMKSTMDWWKEQDEEIRAMAFNPSKEDVTAEEGINRIKKFINENGCMDKKNFIWMRGSLDQMAIDSLCRTFGLNAIAHYSDWRDVRTAIDLIASKSVGGYCETRIPFDRNLVKKHDPRHDVVYDALMLAFAK